MEIGILGSLEVRADGQVTYGLRVVDDVEPRRPGAHPAVTAVYALAALVVVGHPVDARDNDAQGSQWPAGGGTVAGTGASRRGGPPFGKTAPS